MLSSSIDTLALHVAIIFSVCGVSYLFLDFIRKYKIPILSSVSVWALAMILMISVWQIIKKLDLEWCIDVKIKSKISALLTEFAIVSAVASLPLRAVFTYFLPITIMLILGFIGTWYCIKYYCYKYFRNNYAFERAISITGTSFGVFLTGILLLKICDSEFSSPVLGDYSLGFSITALIGPLMIVSAIILSANYGVITPLLLNIVLILIFSFILQKINKN